MGIFYLLHKFGESEQDVRFYTDKYLRAFPTFLKLLPLVDFMTQEQMFVNCYRVRTFERFLAWFGFVEEDLNRGKVKRTPVFSMVLLFE